MSIMEFPIFIEGLFLYLAPGYLNRPDQSHVLAPSKRDESPPIDPKTVYIDTILDRYRSHDPSDSNLRPKTALMVKKSKNPIL